MKKEYRSETEADETAWTIEAMAEDGHVTAEVVGATTSDGTIALQLKIDGGQEHLAMLEDIAHELQSSLFGLAKGRRPAEDRLAATRQELPRAYLPWTEADEKVLLERWDVGDTVNLIAERLERGPGGVRSRLIKLGRIKDAG
jgi:hypothetical protein